MLSTSVSCLKRKPKELSGGQRQRVAAGPRDRARAARVFLMDEPLSNLDAQAPRPDARRCCRTAPVSVYCGTTTIYVTHDQVEAMTMGDRIAVMNAGILQQLDTPENLHERPTNLFVAGFIGSPSMNFFPAKIVGSGTGAVADAGFFRAPVKGQAAEATGRDVILGIRPEDIDDLASAQQNGHLPVETKVEVVEFLGNELQLQLSADGQTFVARVSTNTQTRPGSTLRVGFNLKKLHVPAPAQDWITPDAAAAPSMDDRLSALSGIFGPAPTGPEAPAPVEPPVSSWAPPTVDQWGTPAQPAPGSERWTKPAAPDPASQSSDDDPWGAPPSLRPAPSSWSPPPSAPDPEPDTWVAPTPPPATSSWSTPAAQDTTSADPWGSPSGGAWHTAAQAPRDPGPSGRGVECACGRAA